MKLGIQRRTVILEPATDDDVLWMIAQLNDAETYKMLGFSEPAAQTSMITYLDSPMVIGIIKRSATRERIGFVAMHPQEGVENGWHFMYAIPEKKDRDAFSALSSTDAMAHYMFDHLEVEGLYWAVRQDNAASHAIVKRLGYQAKGTRSEGDANYTLFSLDRKGWAARKAKIGRYAAKMGEEVFATFEPTCAPRFTTVSAESPSPRALTRSLVP